MDPTRHEGPLQLVFSGECIDGHDPRAVRETVARALKLDEKRAARLFSGQPVVLRRQVDAETARRHIDRFAAMGALLRAQPMPPSPPRPEPVQAMEAPTRSSRARPWRRLRRTSRRLLRWAGIGLLSIVFGVGLGLVLGPGLNSPWPDEPARNDAGPPAVRDAPERAPAAPAAVVVPPAPPPARAASPAQAAVAEAPSGMAAEASREYRYNYLAAPKHKAFAISSSGFHAWVAGAPSEDDAREGAMNRCVNTMPVGDDGCRIVDADGEWLD